MKNETCHLLLYCPKGMIGSNMYFLIVGIALFRDFMNLIVEYLQHNGK